MSTAFINSDLFDIFQKAILPSVPAVTILELFHRSFISVTFPSWPATLLTSDILDQFQTHMLPELSSTADTTHIVVVSPAFRINSTEAR